MHEAEAPLPAISAHPGLAEASPLFEVEARCDPSGTRRSTAAPVRLRKMSQFIVRVELHSATASDYANLHIAMQRNGFSRTVTDRSGAVRRLPEAEYYIESPATVTQVFQSAQTAATGTGRPNSVLVTEAKTIWFQLPAADTSRAG